MKENWAEKIVKKSNHITVCYALDQIGRKKTTTVSLSKWPRRRKRSQEQVVGAEVFIPTRLLSDSAHMYGKNDKLKEPADVEARLVRTWCRSCKLERASRTVVVCSGNCCRW